MTKRVLIIGGYGNFGSYIARKLAKEDMIVIIAGRSENKCRRFIEGMDDCFHEMEYFPFDITKSLPFQEIKPDIVIHTSGPFQGQGYKVAEACIEIGCHYIDLSDGREFVAGIADLNNRAVAKGVVAISGASSVPCLSSAIIQQYIGQFSLLDKVEYGIATAQQTNRGLATTASILGYTGRPFKTLIDGEMTEIYGWQDLYFHKYPELGYRALSNCEIPDLELFPRIYQDIKTIRFSAGTEITFMHLGLWALSWLVRVRLIKSLKPAAKFFLKIAHLFDWMGSSNSAFHMKMTGVGKSGDAKEIIVYLLAKEGHGPLIPCAPAIILARELARNSEVAAGAYPCVELIDLKTYMDELCDLNIKLIEE